MIWEIILALAIFEIIKFISSVIVMFLIKEGYLGKETRREYMIRKIRSLQEQLEES